MLLSSRENLAGASSIIAIASAKGGVGKSVVAVNVGAALALKGRKVVIFDANLNAPSIISMLGMKTPRGLPLVEGIEPVSGPYGIRVLSSELVVGGEAPAISFLDDEAPAAPPRDSSEVMGYGEALARMLSLARIGVVDTLIIDLAPGIERLYEISRMAPLKAVVMVSNSSEHGVAATRNSIRIASRLEVPIAGLVENMAGFSCDSCRSVRPLFPEGNLAGIASEFSLPVLGRLSFDPRIAEASDRGVLFVHEFSDTPIAKNLAVLAHAFEKMIANQREPDAAEK